MSYQSPKPLTYWDYTKELWGIARALKYPFISKGQLPDGKGKKVVLFPGFWASPRTMFLLRIFLKRMGYQVYDWGLGKNLGTVPEYVVSSAKEVQKIYSDEKLILIGWSLGGYIAREVARDFPDLIEKVIMLGTPVVGGPKYTLSASWYQSHGFDVEEMANWVQKREEVPLKIPVVAFYNPHDRIVSPKACMDPYNSDVNHIEIDTPHMAMAFDPILFIQVAKVLL